jgi:RNA polymerase sigma-70 factor (ECF subfamily)
VRWAITNLRPARNENLQACTQPTELAQVFREHSRFVWRVLRRFGMSDADAEDGVQEVFLIVAHKLPTYEERGAIRAWLFTLARQVASHARRSDTRRALRDRLAQPPSAGADPQRSAEQMQAKALMERFLDALSEGQAMVFYLSEVEGLRAPEVAAALDLPLTTVYGRQRLARKLFEQFVQRNCGQGAGS